MKLKVLMAAILIIAGLVVWKWRTILLLGDTTPEAANVISCKVKLGNERDFGYRIGDVIPLTVELFEPKGFAFQLEELSAEGDFELLDLQVTNKKSRLNGTRYLLSGNAQSFAFQPKLDLRLSISIRDIARKEESILQLPVQSVYTSKTYDGRMRIEENSLSAVHGNHWFITLAIVACGILGAAFSLRALGLRQREPEQVSQASEPMTPRRQAMLAFFQAWQQWSDTDWEGPCQKMSFALRQWFRIESTMLRDVPMVTGEPLNGPITTILTIMENALYSGKAPTAETKETVWKSFAKVFFPARSEEETEAALAKFVSSMTEQQSSTADREGG